MNNIKDPHSLKMLFRCWLASWVCIILLPIDSALQVLGQAAFFVCMVTAFLPANLPVFSWFIANGTLVFGSCMGWAWGCAAMAAALRARDSTLLQSQLQRVQSSVAGATNPEQEYQAAIFRAEFLDPRSSTVFGVFLAVGSYVAALIFTQSPKLRFAAIFMVIVLDVMASYGPLFPVSQYTLGSIFLLPIGVSLGISFACMLLIFPETLSWGWQRNLSKLIKLSRTYLATHNAFLSELAQEGTNAQETITKYDAKLQPLQAGCIALIEAMQGQKPFLHMEITYAALSGKDLAALLDPVKQWIMRSFGLMAFNFALSTATEDDIRGDEEAEPSAKEKAMRQDDQSKPVHVNDTHALMYMRRRVHRAEKANHVSFKDDLLPLLVDGSRDVLSKAFHALDTMTSWLDYTNEHRYFGQYTAEQHSQLVASLQQAADDLEESLQRFENDERLRLVMPYEKHFGKAGSSADGPLILRSEEAREYRAGARSLFICLVWCFNVIGAGRNLVALTRAAHDTAVKRPKSKVWYPTGLRKLGHLLVSKDGGEAVNAMPADSGSHSDESTMAESMHDEEADESSLETKAERKERKKAAKEEKAARRAWGKRDADALAPSSAFHHFGRGLASAYRFAWSPRGLFALRFTIAGMALWIPAVVNQPVAAFSYNHRVLWAIIMAQLGVSLSQGEQVFSLMSRVIGTVLGAMLGAALWYISCGNSPTGNPYGYGAVTAVAFIPMVFLRLFAPLSLLILCLMTFVTMILVMGYSWIDAGHLVITADSGIGIGVAWRRMLLVLIGIAASVIVTLFPRPSSTREVVRLSFAKLSGRRILNLYSKVIEAWATHTGAETTSTPGQSQRQDGQLSKSSPDSAISAEQAAILDDFRGQLLAAYAHYRDLTGKVGLAKLDLQVRGKWPAARYGQLLKTHRRMVSRLCSGGIIL